MDSCNEHECVLVCIAGMILCVDMLEYRIKVFIAKIYICYCELGGFSGVMVLG